MILSDEERSALRSLTKDDAAFQALLDRYEVMHQAAPVDTSQQQLHAIFDSAPVGIALGRADDYTIARANPAFVHMVGYSTEELRTMTVVDLTLPDDYPEEDQYIAEMLAGTRTSYTIEKRYIHKDGTVFPVRVHASLLPDGGAGVVIVEDLRPHKAAEALRLEHERQQIALAKEQELSRLKTLMMTRIAHEFRTPLSIIATSAYLLQRSIDQLNYERGQDRLAQIEYQVAHLKGLLDEMASIIRLPDDDSPRFHPGRFDLRQLCLGLIDFTSRTTRHTFDFAYEGSDVIDGADRELIAQILKHLLSNAVKYSAEETTIGVSVMCTPSVLTLQVCDEGIGIPPEDELRIFEPFYRGHNFDERPGLGLGLTKVRDAVALHKGTLTYETALDKGTTFTVTLALAPGGIHPC